LGLGLYLGLCLYLGFSLGLCLDFGLILGLGLGFVLGLGFRLIQEMLMQIVKIGTEFVYLDKRWKITGISKKTIYFKSLDGSLKSQIETSAFEKVIGNG
jgi:hypothetical protein